MALASAVLIIVGLCATGCSAESWPSERVSGQDLSLSDASNTVYRCLVDRGWDPEITWDGSIAVDSETMPSEQLPRYDEDSADCWAEVDARTDRMTESEIRAAYAEESETRACLIDHGIDVEEPPSEQVYIDRFHGERWSAYGVAELGQYMSDDDAWRKLNEDCRQPSWSFGAE